MSGSAASSRILGTAVTPAQVGRVEQRAEIAQHAGPQALGGQHETRLQLQSGGAARARSAARPARPPRAPARRTAPVASGPSGPGARGPAARPVPARRASSSCGQHCLPQAPDVALDPLDLVGQPIEQRRLQPLAGDGVQAWRHMDDELDAGCSSARPRAGWNSPTRFDDRMRAVRPCISLLVP